LWHAEERGNARTERAVVVVVALQIPNCPNTEPRRYEERNTNSGDVFVFAAFGSSCQPCWDRNVRTLADWETRIWQVGVESRESREKSPLVLRWIQP
jgi:hypothetical protein